MPAADKLQRGAATAGDDDVLDRMRAGYCLGLIAQDIRRLLCMRSPSSQVNCYCSKATISHTPTSNRLPLSALLRQITARSREGVARSVIGASENCLGKERRWELQRCAAKRVAISYSKKGVPDSHLGGRILSINRLFLAS